MIKEIYKELDRLPKNQDPVVLEIGMHYGEDTVYLKNIFKCQDHNYHGFEPDPRNVDQIRELGIDKVISFFPLAVSDNVSTAKMYLSEGTSPSNEFWTGSSSIRRPKGHLEAFPWLTFENQVQVDTVTLDKFKLDMSLDKIEFIWIDAQGSEDMIFSGGKDTLRNTRYIFFEYYDSEMYSGQKNLQQLMNMLGDNWQIIKQYPNDVLVENRNFKNDIK